MATITVKVRSDIGDPGTHPRFGPLKPGTEVTMQDDEFGSGLFERPSPEWLSPLELADQARAAQEKQRIGDFDPPVEPAPAPAAKPSKKQEVTDVA